MSGGWRLVVVGGGWLAVFIASVNDGKMKYLVCVSLSDFYY